MSDALRPFDGACGEVAPSVPAAPRRVSLAPFDAASRTPTFRAGLATRGAAQTLRRTRLANVVHSLAPGGTERLVVEMSLAFAGEFDVEVVCLDEPGVWAEALETKGISVHCVRRRPGIDLRVAHRLAQHFRKTGVDIVHAHQCTPWIYAALSRLLYAAPRLLLEEHGRFFPEVESPRRIRLNRLLLRRLTHRFVAVSEDVRRRLQRYEGLESEHIDVIYNGVKEESPLEPSARRALRRSLGFGPNDFVVGTAGRLDAIKNIPLLVESLARATSVAPQLRGLLIGDGPEFAGIESLIRTKGLAGRVEMTGFRQDVRTLIACMDLFMLSSFSEGTSVALLEAMSAAIPVAVTNVGGNGEIVIDGRTGWVVPSNSVDALSDAIAQCVTRTDVRQRFATAGQHRFRARFTFDRMIARYRDRYEALCPTVR